MNPENIQIKPGPRFEMADVPELIWQDGKPHLSISKSDRFDLYEDERPNQYDLFTSSGDLVAIIVVVVVQQQNHQLPAPAEERQKFIANNDEAPGIIMSGITQVTGLGLLVVAALFNLILVGLLKPAIRLIGKWFEQPYSRPSVNNRPPNRGSQNDRPPTGSPTIIHNHHHHYHF